MKQIKLMMIALMMCLSLSNITAQVVYDSSYNGTYNKNEDLWYKKNIVYARFMKSANYIQFANGWSNGKVNTTNNNSAIDCKNDTLNQYDQYGNISTIYSSIYNIGFSRHNQGFKILDTMSNGKLGWIYGYIDYELNNTYDVTIYGIYYESKFDKPIICNNKLYYPYNGVFIDTLIIRDTITHHIYDTTIIKHNVYDTIVINDTTFHHIYDTIPVYDTINVVINTSISSVNNNIIKIYPNPVIDYLYLDNALNCNITIYDNRYTKIKEYNNVNNTYIINFTSYSPGIYYLEISNDKNRYTKKLIKL